MQIWWYFIVYISCTLVVVDGVKRGNWGKCGSGENVDVGGGGGGGSGGVRVGNGDG